MIGFQPAGGLYFIELTHRQTKALSLANVCLMVWRLMVFSIVELICVNDATIPITLHGINWIFMSELDSSELSGLLLLAVD